MADTMLASEVAHAFGFGATRGDLVEVARGAMGFVFRLETERGPVAVKKLFHGCGGDEEKNLGIQLAAVDAGVALPRPILTAAGDVLAQLDDGGWWRAYEWVDGSRCSTEPAPIHVTTTIASSLGLLHALALDPGGPVGDWYLGGITDDQVHAALDAATSRGFEVEAARVELPALAAIANVVSSDISVACHNDADRSNVLVDGDKVRLIDWDNAGPGYAAGEFAGALFGWACEGLRPDRALVESMVHAYRDAGGTFAPQGREVFAPSCSSWVHYIVNCCEHLVDPELDEAALAFERPLVERLATFDPTIAKFDAILELVPNG